MTPLGVCERMVQARGDGIVRVRNAWAASPDEAAPLFGLRASREVYHPISPGEARAVLVAVLTRDLAYGCARVPEAEAASLADAFLALFPGPAARWFTNGDFGIRADRKSPGASWTPATDATFDTGVLVLDAGRIGCAWFMDED